MARNDGIDRTVARNQDLETPADVAKVQEHNEREKDSYSNQDIVPERTSLNVHFKAPTDDYVKMFEQMEQDGVISTRGLKPDAVKYGELVFDVNSAYFYNHGGYEFAKQFYADAYKAAAEIVGGEQYILSAVMHADERNRAMSEALGEDVYHYHLHVVYIPVVEKQILWSKRCKDEALRGTVKEVITQVSRSKKWESKPVLDEDGNPKLNEKGKKILEPLCGSGRFLVPFVERGLDISGIDLSNEMLQKLKQKLPEAKVVQADIIKYSPREKFDYIFISSGSVSLFTDTDLCKQILCRIKEWLSPMGKFVFAVDTIANRCTDDNDYAIAVSVKTKENFELVLKSKNHYDEQSQTQLSPGIYEMYSDTKLIQSEFMDFQTHLYKYGEMEEYLKEVGFTQVKTYSSFDKEIAINDRCEMFLFECSL